MHVRLQRYRENVYTRKILQIVQLLYEKCPRLWHKLEEKLQDNSFRCAWNGFIYVLQFDNDTEIIALNFDEVKPMAKQYHYEECIRILSMEEHERIDGEQRDVKYTQRFHSFFLDNLATYDKKYCGYDEVK